jgi:hypothetical protein
LFDGVPLFLQFDHQRVLVSLLTEAGLEVFSTFIAAPTME